MSGCFGQPITPMEVILSLIVLTLFLWCLFFQWLHKQSLDMWKIHLKDQHGVDVESSNG